MPFKGASSLVPLHLHGIINIEGTSAVLYDKFDLLQNSSNITLYDLAIHLTD